MSQPEHRSDLKEIRRRIEDAGLRDGYVIEDQGTRFLVRDQTQPPMKGRRRRAIIREAVMGMTDVWVGVQLKVPEDDATPPTPRFG